MGAVENLIRKTGVEYDIRNASGGGGRAAPSYGADGTLPGVLEQRGTPTTATDSSGNEVETDSEIRAIVDDGIKLREAGSADGYPTLLDHPTDRTYRLLSITTEDGGVSVLTVVEV